MTTPACSTTTHHSPSINNSPIVVCSLYGGEHYLMERIVVPAEPDVPEPGLAPQADDAIHQDEGVEYPPRNKCKNKHQSSCSHLHPVSQNFCKVFGSSACFLWRSQR